MAPPGSRPVPWQRLHHPARIPASSPVPAHWKQDSNVCSWSATCLRPDTHDRPPRIDSRLPFSRTATRAPRLDVRRVFAVDESALSARVRPAAGFELGLLVSHAAPPIARSARPLPSRHTVRAYRPTSRSRGEDQALPLCGGIETGFRGVRQTQRANLSTRRHFVQYQVS